MKTILITGATDGIGLQVTKDFVLNGNNVVIHGRNEEKLNNLKEELKLLNNKIEVYVYKADLSILDEVYKMCDDIIKDNIKIDVILNNAGILLPNLFKEGNKINDHFLINTISPYIISNKLINKIDSISRVINVSSAAQAPIDYSLLEEGGQVTGFSAYAQSKLALSMSNITLSEEYKDIVFISVNPKSFLGTKMVKNAYGQNGHDIKQGSDILFKLSLNDNLANKSGCYYDNDNNMFNDIHPFGLNKENRMILNNILKKYID